MPQSQELPIVTHDDGSGLRAERLEWTYDEVFCESCGARWIAVRSIGCCYLTLDCPDCGAEDSELWDEPNECEAVPVEH